MTYAMTSAPASSSPPSPPARSLALASRAVHADDGVAAHRAVAPAMHVSTTFRYADDPDRLDPDNTVDVRHLFPSTLSYPPRFLPFPG